MSQTRRDFLRQTGCAALGTGLLAAGLQDFALVNALAQTGAADYRALVCVFLSGGNDGNNTVVPTDDRYTLYSNERAAAGLAIPNAGQAGGLLQLNNVPYGLHPSMTGMQDIYNQGRMAVVCNTGPLVEPLTKASYQGTGQKPAQLFSHSDQIAAWQSSAANGVSSTGWGGRVADAAGALNGAATFPQLVTIAGISLFVTGQTARPLAIADANTPLAQVLPLTMTGGTTSEQSARRAAFDQIRALASGTLVKASADVTDSALRTSAALAAANPATTVTFPNTSIGRQLLQVARLVKLRDTLGMKRQIFFCQLGGFDTHSNQVAANGQGALLTQASAAIKAFYDEMNAQGVADKVTTFTLSDFGRTFQPAGAGAGVGSDHAWGNHHFICGGAVRGGFYGNYPTLQRGGPDDTDSGANPRGRWIPTTSVEQYAATLALWYGLAQSDLTTVFPFLARFPSANLGFMG